MARGDHIRVRRLGGLYYHHGIDLGDGTVVHFDGEPFRKFRASIKRVSMETFSRGLPVEVVKHKNALPRARTVLLALEHVGKKGYNLLFNNCEHFAYWCKTGKKRSVQVQQYARNGLILMATATVVLVGTTLVRRRPSSAS
jgi:hypothetical protein